LREKIADAQLDFARHFTPDSQPNMIGYHDLSAWTASMRTASDLKARLEEKQNIRDHGVSHFGMKPCAISESSRSSDHDEADSEHNFRDEQPCSDEAEQLHKQFCYYAP
jgi:hypothetical protein